MSVPTGPRTIEYVKRGLRVTAESPDAARGMVGRLGEVGEPAPADVDGTWCRIEPLDPSVLILLHQTNLNFPTRLERADRPPVPPRWLYTLGPFKSGPFVHAVRAHWTRRLSLALRSLTADGTVRTALWHDAKVAVDFDGPSGAFWLDWTAEPVGQELALWTITDTPALERTA